MNAHSYNGYSELPSVWEKTRAAIRDVVNGLCWGIVILVAILTMWDITLEMGKFPLLVSIGVCVMFHLMLKRIDRFIDIQKQIADKY